MEHYTLTFDQDDLLELVKRRGEEFIYSFFGEEHPSGSTPKHVFARVNVKDSNGKSIRASDGGWLTTLKGTVEIFLPVTTFNKIVGLNEDGSRIQIGVDVQVVTETLPSTFTEEEKKRVNTIPKELTDQLGYYYPPLIEGEAWWSVCEREENPDQEPYRLGGGQVIEKVIEVPVFNDVVDDEGRHRISIFGYEATLHKKEEAPFTEIASSDVTFDPSMKEKAMKSIFKHVGDVSSIYKENVPFEYEWTKGKNYGESIHLRFRNPIHAKALLVFIRRMKVTPAVEIIFNSKEKEEQRDADRAIYRTPPKNSDRKPKYNGQKKVYRN